MKKVFFLHETDFQNVNSSYIWDSPAFFLRFLLFLGSLGFPDLKDSARTFISLQRFLRTKKELSNFFPRGKIPVERFLKVGFPEFSKEDYILRCREACSIAILEGFETDSTKSFLEFLDDLVEGHLSFFSDNYN